MCAILGGPREREGILSHSLRQIDSTAVMAPVLTPPESNTTANLPVWSAWQMFSSFCEYISLTREIMKVVSDICQLWSNGYSPIIVGSVLRKTGPVLARMLILFSATEEGNQMQS